MSDAIFVPDGGLFIPQPTAAGPWFPGVQHGGAVTGLLARSIEATPAAQPVMLTRLSVDMSRKVPMGPTRVDTEIVRDGKRVQAIGCRYVVDDEIVARAARCAYASTRTSWVPARAANLARGCAAARSRRARRHRDHGPGHRLHPQLHHATGRTGAGALHQPASAQRPFVTGEQTSPMTFAAAVGDMIPSAGSIVDFEKFLSVNPDLSLHFHRVPDSEWIGCKSLVLVSPYGFGQTDAQLFDTHGAFGRSLKSLLIDHR